MTIPVKYLPVIVCLSLLYASCRTAEHDRYAIRDFSPALQPWLVTIVTNGIADGTDSASRYVFYHISDEELKRLARSEHPVLRATALADMLKKPGFDPFTVLMEHLDDTALVTVDMGEFGTQYSTVSDRLIYVNIWKSQADKDKTIDAVLTKHNYLKSAYTVLWQVEPGKKYYPFVKDMAQRGKDYSLEERALDWLADCGKPEDTALIRTILTKNVWHMGGLSFGLMSRHPREGYLDIMDEYRRRYFYRRICSASTYPENNDDPESFINCLASYKNKRSATILSNIIRRKPFLPCANDSASIIQNLQDALWSNRCPAYDSLIAPFRARKLAEDKSRAENKSMMGFKVDSIPGPPTIRWQTGTVK